MTHTHFWKKTIIVNPNGKGFSRVEDQVGLLKERDQTIVTLETEVSEVTYKKQQTLHAFADPNYS